MGGGGWLFPLFLPLLLVSIPKVKSSRGRPSVAAVSGRVISLWFYYLKTRSVRAGEFPRRSGLPRAPFILCPSFLLGLLETSDQQAPL